MRYTIDEERLTGIADAIREKRDLTTPIKPEDMPLEISLIEGGGDSSGIVVGSWVQTSTSTDIKDNGVVGIPMKNPAENFFVICANYSKLQSATAKELGTKSGASIFKHVYSYTQETGYRSYLSYNAGTNTISNGYNASTPVLDGGRCNFNSGINYRGGVTYYYAYC